LSKLLNKKATAYLKLDDFTEALECFKESLDVEMSDYAIFGRGICEYELDLDIDSGFRGFLEISKRQMLKQASVLKELGYHEDSMRILKFLRENHFKNDEVYKKMAMLMD
jgi:tetratricopeptide (TPR) repeat protein